jgi:hypothetical protein
MECGEHRRSRCVYLICTKNKSVFVPLSFINNCTNEIVFISLSLFLIHSSMSYLYLVLFVYSPHYGMWRTSGSRCVYLHIFICIYTHYYTHSLSIYTNYLLHSFIIIYTHFLLQIHTHYGMWRTSGE